MSHGVWHASGTPVMKSAPAGTVGDSDTALAVRGDKLTVKKNGKRVRIFVEYVGKGFVEGTVLRTAGGFSKGSWIHAELKDAVGISEYQARITYKAELD